MINWKKWFKLKSRSDRRIVFDRRKDHLQAEISDILAETATEDFPLLTRRSIGRREMVS